MPISEKTVNEFAEWGKEPPTSEGHGTDRDISEQMKPLKPRNWRMEGNRLIADTEMGELVQFISTDYILTGTDEDGKPILTKIG